MITTEFVEAVQLQATGKKPTFPSGSTKWLQIVALGNFFQNQWARERNVDWDSLYDPEYSIGTVSATNSFDLDDDILKLSQQEGDTVRITHLDGRYTDYDIVDANRLKDYTYGNVCAKVGRTIRFNKTFAVGDQQYGGEILIPAYIKPEPFSLDNDEIAVDDPNWLVFVTAADRVRNDVTRKDLRADLINQANEAMQGMKDDNAGQVTEVSRPWNPLGHLESDC